MIAKHMCHPSRYNICVVRYVCRNTAIRVWIKTFTCFCPFSKQIRSIDRKQEVPHDGPMCDLLWSDPEGLRYL